ncbi:MAG: phosphomannomutase CpsG [Gammaproteobacteria bacterium]|jgi:phosphomannomutase|nr:phosphomannomutase CpsG [Gammaproteobacteria bacterium]MBT7369889.1 phosphomannomutase CpsG [Gammaproteobacteria bacterium]
MTGLSAFRLGDIRGLYPEEINEDFVMAFAQAFVGQFGLTGRVATGRDMRDSSESLQAALNESLVSVGIEVVDMGLCPTELGYFASGLPGINAAIVVTASHNPARYNGLKCVLSGGEAITQINGLDDIRNRIQEGYRHPVSKGSIVIEDLHGRYLEFLRLHFPPESLQAGQIALNGLNGTASTMAGIIASEFQLPVTWFREGPGPIPEQGADPTNPLLVAEMKMLMQGDSFSLGVAWDGDCDRCVCFDSRGDLIPTYYLLGLLMEHFLERRPGGTIVFDNKLCWNTMEVVQRCGGKPMVAATGHAFMKQKMRETDAIYGGELSAHHYFGEFFGCDSGMFAWLTVLKLLKESDTPIHELISARRQAICSTAEISVNLDDVDVAFATLDQVYGAQALETDRFDGLAYTMPGGWRFSVRRSKTEPVVRLNFESRGKPEDLLEAGEEVIGNLESFRSDDENWLEHFQIQ